MKLWNVIIWFTFRTSNGRQANGRTSASVLTECPRRAIEMAFAAIHGKTPSAVLADDMAPTAVEEPTGIIIH